MTFKISVLENDSGTYDVWVDGAIAPGGAGLSLELAHLHEKHLVNLLGFKSKAALNSNQENSQNTQLPQNTSVSSPSDLVSQSPDMSHSSEIAVPLSQSTQPPEIFLPSSISDGCKNG